MVVTLGVGVLVSVGVFVCVGVNVGVTEGVGVFVGVTDGVGDGETGGGVVPPETPESI